MGHHLYCMFFVAFSAHVAINCFASEVFDGDSGQTPVNQGFVCRSRQERSLSNNDTEMTSMQPSRKKWQVGRVSRKQYEIVNMLWRKTKVFIDVESTTSSSQANKNNSGRKNSNNRLETNFVSRLITPSFIEFYYLDESEDLNKHKDSSMNKLTLDKTTPKTVSFEQRRPITHYPIISFRVNDPNIKPLNRKQRINPDKFLIDHLIQARNYSFGKHFKSMKLIDLFGNKTILGKKLVSVKVYLNGSRVSTTQSTKKHETETSKQPITPLPTTVTSFRIQSKTPCDRIKFFEIYDSNTVSPSLTNKNKSKNNDYENSDEKIDLENVDQNIGHFNSQSKLRYEKKHITVASSTTTIAPVEENFRNTKENSSIVVRERNASELSLEQKLTPGVANESKLASWTAYPFVAVYVYEPTQTHCDAAGISPHWLIAAGSCLSRHGSVHSVEARSAFVTYCGESWRQPERIAYVKNSFVHPKFHPRDKARRYNYNIGLIEVSNSMVSSCPKWSPITLMSHQFAASPGGSLLSALGWGLDRYGTKYMTKNVPHWPLTVYEGLVYSDSCPGSNAYSKAKHEGVDNSGEDNVYCLLLPPYSGEESDPVHGGLLLDGGKLVALYLQEERRPRGAQSAQYTGVWRLIPWVLEEARERDDMDSFSLDM